MARAALEEAREILADAEFTHDALDAALRAGAAELKIKAGPDVPAHPRGGVRAQGSAAAV